LNKNLKARSILSSLIFVVGTVLVIYFSTYMHLILSKTFEGIKLYKLEYILDSLKLSSSHLKLFLSFEALVLLISALFFFTNDKPYQSDLVQITPDISTPVPAGQKQFGSAKWMKEDEKNKLFSFVKLKENDPFIKYLIGSGLNDIQIEEKKRLKEVGIIED